MKYLKQVQINFLKNSLNNLNPNLSLRLVPTNDPGETHYPLYLRFLRKCVQQLLCVHTHTHIHTHRYLVGGWCTAKLIVI